MLLLAAVSPLRLLAVAPLTLWATGQDADGQLGDGSTTDRHLPVQIATGVVSASAGFVYTLVLASPTTPPSPFASWVEDAGLSGADAAPDADPDADGLPNLLEYVFASSPAQASPASVRPSAEVQSVDGQTYLVFTHRRRKSAASACAYQPSTDLVSWSPISLIPAVLETRTAMA